MDVSIIIVNWNSADYLRKCLAGIYNYTTGIDFEVIVVDNASYDGAADMVRKEFPSVIFRQSEENLGFARGNNLGAKEAKGKHILFLNPDVELRSNSLPEMFWFLEKDSSFGAVGCRLVNSNGSTQYVCARTYPTPFNQFCFLAMLDRIFPGSKVFSTVEMRYWDHKTSREVDCLSGACIMARKEVIDKLSGFDENIFMYAEDVDLCFRIRQRGLRIYYMAEHEIFHFSGGSSARQSDRFFNIKKQREANAYFFLKHYGKAKAKRYLLSVFLGSAIRILAATLSIPVLAVKTRADMVSIFYPLQKYASLFAWSIKYRDQLG